MYKIGLSACGKVMDDKLFQAYRDAGIDAMEVCLSDEKEYPFIDYGALYRYAKEYGVELWSYHLPFSGEIRIDDRKFAKETVAYWQELIKKAADIGIPRFVVHPSSEPISEENRKAHIECAKESLFRLAECAKVSGGVIAVEDLPRSCLGNCSDEMLELLSAHGDLKVCFDTNHLLGEDAVQFIRRLKGKIITTHVSDYDFVNERHWLPGEGKIDWASIISALQEIEYDGAWLYELGFVNNDTVLRDRALTCADFVNNAKEIFAGKKPTRYSKDKPNLGFWG